MHDKTRYGLSQGREGVNLPVLVTEITGINARTQFYVYGMALLLAIMIACMKLEGVDPFHNVKFIAWRAYQITGV